MSFKFAVRGLAAAGALALALPGVGNAAAAPVVSCESLAKLALPQATITMAKTVAPGEFVLPGQTARYSSGMDPAGHLQAGANPTFCRIAATLKPTSDSDIRIEVWLPQSGWNGKFLGIASFGWGGSISYAGLLSGLQEGYAVANTDTGHQGGSGGEFSLGHPEKLIDYAYRADHEMTVKAKAIVKAFYGAAPTKSYWIGCSLGGLEGLVEAKRYPADYDGIVVGAPPNPIVKFNAGQLWPNWLIAQDPTRLIPREKYAVIHKAVIAQCASGVGREQNFLEEPDKCAFQPKSLQCKAGDAADCLTAAQVYLLEKIYQGPVNPRTGQVIFPGPAKGSELDLTPFVGTSPMGPALDLYRYAAFQDPKWDSRSMDWDKDVSEATRILGPSMHVDADLKAFFDRGGKMLMYVGWNDYHNPEELADYYKAVVKNSPAKTRDQLRLFTIPGMGHCQGGPGCDTFNKLSVIDSWVTKGVAPERIVTVKAAEGKVIRTRPICAYPKVAKYKGAGDTTDAANFVCAAG